MPETWVASEFLVLHYRAAPPQCLLPSLLQERALPDGQRCTNALSTQGLMCMQHTHTSASPGQHVVISLLRCLCSGH